jgi:hypothetical protein
LYPLNKFDIGLLFWSTKNKHDIIMKCEHEGPMYDIPGTGWLDWLDLNEIPYSIVSYSCQYIILVLFWIALPNEKDCSILAL